MTSDLLYRLRDDIGGSEVRRGSIQQMLYHAKVLSNTKKVESLMEKTNVFKVLACYICTRDESHLMVLLTQHCV